MCALHSVNAGTHTAAALQGNAGPSFICGTRTAAALQGNAGQRFIRVSYVTYLKLFRDGKQADS